MPNNEPKRYPENIKRDINNIFARDKRERKELERQYRQAARRNRWHNFRQFFRWIHSLIREVR